MEPIPALRRQSAIDDLLRDDWLKRVEWLAQVDSTNNSAKDWFASHHSEIPALFVADAQTAGRGRGGNQWWSPNGCLMMTLIVPAMELPADASVHSQLALVAGIALADAADRILELREHAKTQLKWPNDLYFDGKKVAGILIEAIPGRASSTGFAIGIGVNTRIDWQQAPPQLIASATCLSSIAGRDIEREEVLTELIGILRRQLRCWCNDPFGWQNLWRSRCLLTGRVVQVRSAESGEVTGLCEGIDSSGRLQLRTESQLHVLNACQILSWS